MITPIIGFKIHLILFIHYAMLENCPLLKKNNCKPFISVQVITLIGILFECYSIDLFSRVGFCCNIIIIYVHFIIARQ